jgi:uncharacterized OB-fold protein
MGKKISETKATCKSCGNVYFYGKTEALDNCAASFSNAGDDMGEVSKGALCCTGCWPAVFIPESKRRKVIDYGKCPKCGSRAVTKEKVIHEI